MEAGDQIASKTARSDYSRFDDAIDGCRLDLKANPQTAPCQLL
jgi:hypothetical protein